MKKKSNKIGEFLNIFKDSLIKNSIYLIMANFFNAFLSIIFWIIASKYHSPENIGTISAVFSAISLISMISSIGLPAALVYYLPRDYRNSSRMIDSCIIVGIISSIIFSLVFLFGLNIWSPKLIKNFDIDFSIIFVFISVVFTISSIMSGALIAGRVSSYTVLKDNIYHFIRTVLLILFAGLGIIGVFISLSIGLIFSLIAGYILLYKTWKYLPKLNFDPIIKSMAKYSFENYIAGILFNIPKLVLPIIIINLISSEKTGYFYIAMMAAGLLHGISQSISSSLLAESSDKEKFWNNVNKAIGFNILLLIPGIIFFIIFGKFMLNMFNPIYANNAIYSLIILSIAGIPLSLVTIFNGIKNSQNRVMSTVKMNFIVAFMTIILSLFLIKFDIEGIALSFLISNTIGAIIVINRIKNPLAFTVKLIKDMKKDIVQI